MLVLPILITLWLIHWLYSGLEHYVIDPLAKLILWQVGRRQPDTELPFWFERFAAPLIAILIVLMVLYGLGFIVNSRLRRVIDSIVLRVPGVSVIYDGLRKCHSWWRTPVPRGHVSGLATTQGTPPSSTFHPQLSIIAQLGTHAVMH
jgi:uncharacterized membrane protein